MSERLCREDRKAGCRGPMSEDRRVHECRTAFRLPLLYPPHEESNQSDAETDERQDEWIRPAPARRLQDPEHEEAHAGYRQPHTDQIEFRFRDDRRCINDKPRGEEHADHDQRLETEGDPPTQIRRNPSSDERTERSTCGRNAEEHPVCRCTFGSLVVRTNEGVDGRDDQRRSQPLEDGPPEHDEADGRSEGGDRCADCVDDESDSEGALRPPDVSQFAAGEHERCHRQRVEGDGSLDLPNGRVQVLDEGRDRDIHQRGVDDVDEHRSRQHRQHGTTMTRRSCLLEFVAHGVSLRTAGPPAPYSRSCELSPESWLATRSS